MFSLSSRTMAIWQKICDKKISYLLIFAAWFIPILSSLPKSFQEGITYSGGGPRLGNLCFPAENGTYVAFTKLDGIVNMASFGTHFVIIVTSYAITWWFWRKTVQQAREIARRSIEIGVEGTQFVIDRVEARRKSLFKAIGLIFVCYAVLRIPIMFSASPHGIEFMSPWFATSLILFTLQFCVNIIIYAVFMVDFRKAFLDVFYFMCSCCFKPPRHLDSSYGEI